MRSDFFMRYAVIWNCGKDHGMMSCKSEQFARGYFADMVAMSQQNGHLLSGKVFRLSLYDNTERLEHYEFC